MSCSSTSFPQVVKHISVFRSDFKKGLVGIIVALYSLEPSDGTSRMKAQIRRAIAQRVLNLIGPPEKLKISFVMGPLTPVSHNGVAYCSNMAILTVRTLPTPSNFIIYPGEGLRQEQACRSL